MAAGMVYLSESNIIHSDLAARNILIASKDKYLAKISDLGLSKIIRSDKNYYMSNSPNIPIKW
jgi:serine/threonine protein kinase